MQIKLNSIFVNDQAKALTFYTDTLGFVKKNDIDLGEYRWLTVSETDDGNMELLLEPNAHPAALTFQQAIYTDGIPATMLFTEDIKQDYQNLVAKGVSFKGEPSNDGGPWIATFDDNCGNWIQLVQL